MDLRKSLQTARDNIGDKKLNFSLLKCEQFFYLINGTLSKDWQEKLEVTKSMPPLLKEYVSERIILGMISRQDCKEFLVPALDYLKENEMTIRPFFSEMNSMKNHTKEVQEKVQAITKVSNQRYGSFKTPQELKTMTTEELDLLAGKSNDFRYKMVLLDRAFTDRDVKKVKVLVNDLVKLEFNWDRRYFKLVGFLMSSGCVEEAVTIFNGIADKMENLNPNIPMKLAAAQIESGNFEGCLETLKATCERTGDLNKEEMIYFNINTGRIFKCVTSLEQADAVMAAISLKNLVSDKHAPPILDRYVKNVLDIVTEDKLMEIVSDCVSKYKHFPVMTTVLTKLTKSLNVAQLKVAMTLGTKTMGTTEFHSRLATAFLNADMPTKAAAVLKSPTAKITKRDFHQKSLYFIKKNNIKALENLFEISKDFRVSQAQMLDYLVQGYVSADDTAKALTRLEASVQGHVIPLPSTVDLLTRTLTNKNQEIPQILRDAKNSYGESSV